VISLGERVTVVGQALADDSTVASADECIEDTAFPAHTRIGSVPFRRLKVLAGTPRDVTARGRFRLIVGLIGAMLLVAAIGSFGLALATRPLPPSGTIAFGTSFNPWFGLQGQADTLTSRQTIIAIAEFDDEVWGGSNIAILVDGVRVASWTVTGFGDGPGACRIDFESGQLTPGEHHVDVVLLPGERRLASGTISIGG
jgi:uncharacterized membrane protein